MSIPNLESSLSVIKEGKKFNIEPLGLKQKLIENGSK